MRLMEECDSSGNWAMVKLEYQSRGTCSYIQCQSSHLSSKFRCVVVKFPYPQPSGGGRSLRSAFAVASAFRSLSHSGEYLKHLRLRAELSKKTCAREADGVGITTVY